MIIDIENALTSGNCSSALGNSKRLYQSRYTDNRIRMLYANSLACKAGIRLYEVIDELTSFSSPNALGQFARVFPSAVGDQRLESGWLAQDALQSMLASGSVIGVHDQILPETWNPGSTLATDRTDSSNLYGFFMSMSVIGNTLSRYGAPTPVWGKGADLIWTSRALVQADLTGSACGLVSAFFNLIDGFRRSEASGAFGSAGSGVKVMVDGLDAQLVQGGALACLTSGGTYACHQYYSPGVAPSATTIARCALAKARLRYRGACSETEENAVFAAGMISCVNNLW